MHYSPFKITQEDTHTVSLLDMSTFLLTASTAFISNNKILFQIAQEDAHRLSLLDALKILSS